MRSVVTGEYSTITSPKSTEMIKKQTLAKLYLEQKAIHNLVKRESYEGSLKAAPVHSGVDSSRRCETQILDLQKSFGPSSETKVGWVDKLAPYATDILVPPTVDHTSHAGA